MGDSVHLSRRPANISQHGAWLRGQRGESDLLIRSSRGGRADRKKCELDHSLRHVNAQTSNRFVPEVGLDAGEARIDQVWLLPLSSPQTPEQGPAGDES